MKSNEIGRLKSDLEAVQTAAGLGPRLGFEDVGYGVAVAFKGFHAASGTLLLMGVCLMHIALGDRRRLSYLGWGLPLVIYGFIEPWMSYETWHDLLGICIFCAGILASAILAWQLNSNTSETIREQN